MSELKVRQFKVEGIACAARVEALKCTILALDPEASVEIDPGNGEVCVQSTVSTGLINGAILDAGFEVIHKPAD